MNIGEVLDQLRPDFPGVTIPKIRFLEDKGLIKPERTPSGYRKFSARRRRPAALRPADAARPLPAAQGDRRAPRRDRPRPRAAADRRRWCPPCPRSRWPADGLPSPESFAPDATTCGSRARAAQDRRDRRGAARPARAVRPGHADAAAPATTTPTRWSIATDRARAGRLRLRAPAPAGVQDRRRPRGRPRRAGRRAPRAAAATPPPRPAPRRPSARSPRCRCGCTRPWSRPACAAPDRG